MIDVRPELEFAMYSLPNTINIPYSEILKGDGVNVLEKEIVSREGEQTGKTFFMS